VGARSLDVLAQELTAIGRGRLLRIIAACDLNPAHEDLSQLSDTQLITLIVRGVQARVSTK